MEWFCESNFYFRGKCFYLRHRTHLKVEMQYATHLTNVNTISEYYHASVNLDNVDV